MINSPGIPTRRCKVFFNNFPVMEKQTSRNIQLGFFVLLGLGAIIGHQSGHRDEGAAIGAGIGLLFDLARW